MPQSLNSTGQTGHSVSLSWAPGDDGVSGETYNVYMDGQLVAQGLPVTSYTATGLVPDTMYVFRVSAVLGGIESNKTESLAVQTASVPGKPSVSVSPGDGVLHATATLPTDDGGSAVTSVKFFIKEASQGTWPEVPANTQSSSDLTYDFTGLTNGTDYMVAVIVSNDVGDSEMSNAVHGTPASASA